MLATGTPVAAPSTLPTPSFARLAGVLLIIEGLLLFVPTIILGNAINWPASLSEPAAVMLPLLHSRLGAVQLGYTVYLIYSLLFFPVALLTAHMVARGAPFGPLLQIAVGFAALSTLARSIGIIRWLAAMPGLAAAYVDPAATATQQAAIEASFMALNAYGGAIGEVLGVNLLAAFWLIVLSSVILHTGALPRWLGGFGIVAALALVGAAIELFGVDIGMLIVLTTSGIQFWLLAAGIVLLFRRRAV
jgi:hypothetical protein